MRFGTAGSKRCFSISRALAPGSMFFGRHPAGFQESGSEFVKLEYIDIYQCNKEEET